MHTLNLWLEQTFMLSHVLFIMNLKHCVLLACSFVSCMCVFHDIASLASYWFILVGNWLEKILHDYGSKHESILKLADRIP